MNKIKIKAPAKINLTLEVGEKRNDGFHSIRSIMQAISLYDFVTVCVEPSTETVIFLSGTSKDIPYNHKNLAYKACELFLNKAQKNAKVDIFIEKNIPIEAGLAGGSTDAAAVLYGLNKLFDNIFDKEDLIELCSEIGSDVAFCLFGGTQLASGRGEILEKLQTPLLNLLLIKPKSFGISAKEAYIEFDKLLIKNKKNHSFEMIMAINKGISPDDFLYNDLEDAVAENYPQIAELKLFLKALGCSATLMSGSGSTVFGLVKEEFPLPKDLNAECFFVKTINHGARIDK